MAFINPFADADREPPAAHTRHICTPFPTRAIPTTADVFLAQAVLMEKSLGVLTADNPVRKIAIRACFHRYFDRAVMAVIALNCVFLAMDSKAPGFAETTRGKVVEQSEPVFLALFCAEMAVKIIATGFWGHPNAYLADGWNRMDFFVVILGVLAALDLGNFSAIRVVRVLRPLRTLQGFEGMRRLVVTLLRSMPLLFDVAVLVSFLFFTFGLIGVQLYSGAFSSRCSTLANAPENCELCGLDAAVDASTGCDVDACAAAAAENDWAPRWVATEADETCGGASSAKWPVVDAYEPAGYTCPVGSEGSFCHEGFENPNYGITSFDNVAEAWLTIFQCISLEGWTDVMYYAKDAVSPWSWVYFTSMIIMGAFFAVNLALAVLFVSFVDGKQAAEAEGEASARDGKEAAHALLAGEDQTEDAYQEKQLAKLTGRLERAGTFNHGSGRNLVDMTGGDARATAVVESADAASLASPPSSPASVATPSGVGASFGSSSNRVTPLPASKMRSPSRETRSDAPDTPVSPSSGRTPWLDEGFEDVASWVLSKGAEVEDVRVGDDGVVAIAHPSSLTRAQRTCRRLATSEKMASLTMFLIIANTILMASEFNGMSDATADAYETVNYVITSYFALEMAVKLVGLTPRGYVADKFNIFDGVVVIVSVVELVITSTTGDGGGMLSALRTGRLLRVFKLARSWPQLRNIIITILATIPSMSSLAGMLLLFIFIFDLLGMQLFGYQFIFCDSYGVESAEPLCPPGMGDACPTRDECYAACPAAMADAWVAFDAETGAAGMCKAYTDPGDGEVVYYARLGAADRPRHHFDDFFWSFITIFQVLTGEDWNAVMYDAMRTVGSWTCLYFIAIVVIGNYVVLNLFLAILLDNFSGLDTGGEAKDAKDAGARHARLVEQKEQTKEEEEKERRARRRRDLEKKRALVEDAANAEGDERRAKAATRRLRTAALRKALERFVTHRWFDKTMMCMIVVSSSLLAVDAPAEVDEDSRVRYWLDVSDLFFVGLFVLEAALKIVALGKRYFRNGWNVLDFCIVSLGVASSAITALASGSDENAAVAAKMLRACRALRPLRIASRSAGMRVVISALFSAIPAISNVALVCFLFYLIFGIMGLNLFMGRMHRCVDAVSGEPIDPTKWGLARGEITREWCRAGPRLIACVDDQRAAVYAGGDATEPDGFGWTCGETRAPSVDARDWSYESYGGTWTCVAADKTFAVANGTDADRRFERVGSTFASAATATNPLVKAAAEAAARTGAFESQCEPVLRYLDWRLPKNYDFDHIGSAMLVLFETATLEMWLDVMYHGADATERDAHPWRDANPAACVFFVVFIIVGSFFIMNLFVGVTIDKFNEMKEESAAEYEAELNRARNRGRAGAAGAAGFADGLSGEAYAAKMAAPALARGYSGSKDATRRSSVAAKGGAKGAALMGAVGAVFVTEEQRRWQQVEKMLMQCKPRRMMDPPPPGWRASFYRLVSADAFDGFVGALIALNVAVMCMTHAGESDAFANALFWTNAAFTLVFLVEAVMKIIGFGPSQYLHDAWNRFDALVVSLSVAGFALETATNAKASYLAIMRVARVVRVLRLVKRARGLQTLLQTLVFSLPALFNVASVLFLFFFIYAVMGINLFGFVRDGEVLGRHAHFKNFPDAMAALFRSATGERWNGIMHDCMTTSACVEIRTSAGPYAVGEYVDLDEVDDLKSYAFRAEEDYVDRCTPGVGVTVFYFVSFILLCGFVMLNLVIAVILDNFESYSQSFTLPVSDEDFGEFVEEWSRIDRRASYYVKVARLPELLQKIRAPLGLKSLPKDLRRDALRRTMFTFDVEVRDANRVHFVDVLKHLASRVDGVEDPEAEARARARSRTLSASAFGKKASEEKTSGSGKRNAVHPEPSVDGSVNGFARSYANKPSLMRQMSGSFVWRSSKKKGGLDAFQSGDESDLGDVDAESAAPRPLVCHHFAAIYVQTMWRGKLAWRQAELRKLKKKKRNARRRKAEEGHHEGTTSPGNGNPTSGDESGFESGVER